MDDLISRSALLAAYDGVHQGPPGGARKLIENAPDAIVRCRDCRFREDPQSVISEWLPCQFGRTPDDWFCACGRKDPREECE